MNESPSQAGAETVSDSVPGLPARPPNLPINLVDDVLGETESQSASASSMLADALRGPPLPEHAADDSELIAARAPRKAVSPEDPKKEEVESHALSGHVCFRSWCRHCVRGRSQEAAHSSSQPSPTTLPVISWDYYFLSTSGIDADDVTGRVIPPSDSDPLQISAESPGLVMWDSKTKGLYSHLLPAKGVDYAELEKVLRLVSEDLVRLGHKRVVFRSDGEPALLAFLRELRKYWEGEVIPEQSPVGDPQSNGAAENAVKLTKAHVRTLKDALEHRLQAPVPETSGLMTLLVRHAASAYRQFAVGVDGKTPTERLKGSRSKPMAVEFGEVVWWMALQTSANGIPPLGAKCEEGYWMGLVDGISESLILTPTGLVRCRTIRRRPPGERWNSALLKIDNISELQPNGVQPGETRIGIRAPVHIDPVPGEPALRVPSCPVLRVPRRTQLLRHDFQTHGYTIGCPGCDSIQRGMGEEARHNHTCRTRMEPLLQESEEGQARLQRAHDRVSHYAEAWMREDLKRRAGDSSA